MHRKYPSFLLALLMIFSLTFARAEQTAPAFDDMPGLVRPGKTERLTFSSPTEGEGALFLTDAEGGQLIPLNPQVHVHQGSNTLFWDGMDAQGAPVAPGDYAFVLRFDGADTAAQVKVGDISPRLDPVHVSDASLRPGQDDWLIAATANRPGLLTLSILMDDLQPQAILSQQVPQGDLHIPWDGTIGGIPAAPGLRTLTLTLVEEDGFTSNPQHVLVQVMAPVASPTPEAAASADPQPEATEPSDAAVSEQPLVAEAEPEPTAKPRMQYKIPSLEPIPQTEWGGNYWTTPVGEWDEDKIWEIMVQPLTVITGRDQRETYKLRKTPDSSSKRENIVGEITYVSQGVHILETLDNGWTLVEANNSSYGPNNRSRRGYGDTDEIIKGYVETKYLETVTPRDDFGVLVDKLKQEMYIFKDGKLYTTLIISTGKPTKAQPWNETPSGEFLMVSRVGDFPAGNLTCGMGMRINGGSLIHEVPYLTNEVTGYRDYGPQERQLGQKASHGCIRVQRKNNDDGINMTWVWNNIKLNTKVLVWDDSPGRYHEYPEDSLALYFNPTGGQFYHADQNCSSIKDRYLPLKGSFTYGELESGDNLKFKPCPYCDPPMRAPLIDQLNAANGF